jgi:tape measure domain-containing protein
MASVVDTLVTRFVGDSSSHEAAVGRINMANAGLVTSMSAAIAGVAVAGAAAVAIWYKINEAMIRAGASAFQQFAQYDALAKSLAVIEGNATDAANAMKVLRDIAKMPGIDFQEAVSGFSGLRLQGVSAAESARIIQATGNANALAGGGAEEFGRIMKAIREIMMRPNLTGEELNQLAEAGIPAHKIIKDAFGTVDGGELKRMGVDSKEVMAALIAGLEAMPKAANSAKNALENFNASLGMAMVSIGSGMEQGVTKMLTDVGDAISSLEESGGLKLIGEGIMDMVNALNPFKDAAGGILPVLTDVGASIYSVTQVMAVLNEQFKALATGDFKSLKTPVEIYNDAIMAAAQGYIRFYGQTMIGRASRMMEEDPVLKGGNDAAKQTVNQQTQYLAGIESNTRQMVDLQRMILGGGNLAAMGVTAVELSDMRAGRGSGGASRAESMILSGMRMMAMEMNASLARRRGFGGT